MKRGEVLPKGSIYEVNFGYNAKMEVYTNLSSDIPELSEIHLETFSKYITPHFWTLRLLRRNTFKAKMYIEANRKWLI